MDKLTISHSELIERLSYDPNTGEFVWIADSGRRKIGDLAGRVDNRGYIEIRLRQRSYRAHRLAWFYVHGRWPDNEVDHINGNKIDNRIVNLREATRSQNNSNCGLRSHSTSGLKGVSFHKPRSKWLASIRVDRKQIHLGTFDCKYEAAKAYNEAAVKHHGEFAVLNDLVGGVA